MKNGPLLMCWEAPELEVLRPPLARHALAPVPVCQRPHLQVLASRVRPLVRLPAIRYGPQGVVVSMGAAVR